MVENIPAARSDPEESLIRNEREAVVRKALENLPESYRLPLLMQHYQGMSYREISLALNIPEKTVATRLYRAKTVLREWLLGGEKGEVCAGHLPGRPGIKSRFWAFVLSLVPGGGYFYLGLMKRGLQAMLIFFGTFFAGAMANLDPLPAFVAPIMIFYSVFDTQQLLRKMNEGQAVEDRELFDWGSWESKRPVIGAALIILGLFALLNNLAPYLFPYILNRFVPPLVIVGIGVYILYRNTGKGGNGSGNGQMAAAANTLYGLAPGWILNEDIFRGHTGYVRQWEGQPLDLDQGSRLEIENKVGDIEITASPDSKLHLSARITARGSNEESARAAAEAQRINVETGRVTRVYTDSEWHTSVKLRLEVPAGLNIRASDRMGSILVQKVSAEALTAETSMGMIEVDDFIGFLKA